jgi:TPP-dependent pyruvate/acetoin dehydrogenase alpha subunit
MPPIKRTKFKLSSEQLLEMFYWLKLIRAFDLRLSTLVKQGKVRSGVYTGIGQEAIIVGTCFGLRREDFICPLHRDLGAFLMKGVDARTSSASSAIRACSARTCRSPPGSASPSKWRSPTTS